MRVLKFGACFRDPGVITFCSLVGHDPRYKLISSGTGTGVPILLLSLSLSHTHTHTHTLCNMV